MSHLLVDIGNSGVKSAVASCGAIVSSCREKLVGDSTAGLGLACGISRGIYSSVRELSDEEMSVLDSFAFPVMKLSCRTALPLKIGYSTPETLGPDRIAAAVGAWSVCRGRNLLVIDAGTAITYDLVTADGTFVGGNITPGVSLRLRALHEYTGKLPLVRAEGPMPLVGDSTETAIRSGVVQGVRDEMQGCVGRLSARYGDIFVFLTGGDAHLFEKPIKNGIFADGSLVFKGLECICSFNEID